MKIIDAHMHLGEDLMFNTDDSEEVLLKAMDDNGVAAQLIMPGIMARDQRRPTSGSTASGRSIPGGPTALPASTPILKTGSLPG